MRGEFAGAEQFGFERTRGRAPVTLRRERDGETAFGGEEDGVTIVNLTPGTKFALWRELDLGLGVSFPRTRAAAFDAQGVVSVFWHF